MMLVAISREQRDLQSAPRISDTCVRMRLAALAHETERAACSRVAASLAPAHAFRSPRSMLSTSRPPSPQSPGRKRCSPPLPPALPPPPLPASRLQRLPRSRPPCQAPPGCRCGCPRRRRRLPRAPGSSKRRAAPGPAAPARAAQAPPHTCAAAPQSAGQLPGRARGRRSPPRWSARWGPAAGTRHGGPAGPRGRRRQPRRRRRGASGCRQALRPNTAAPRATAALSCTAARRRLRAAASAIAAAAARRQRGKQIEQLWVQPGCSCRTFADAPTGHSFQLIARTLLSKHTAGESVWQHHHPLQRMYRPCLLPPARRPTWQMKPMLGLATPRAAFTSWNTSSYPAARFHMR